MGGRGACDVHSESPTFGFDAAELLALRGYCTVDPGFGTDFVREAAAEAQRIPRFAPPPEMVVEGLLGHEGSGEVAELEGPAVSEAQRSDGEHLRQLDGFLTWAASSLEPHLEPGFGFRCGERTVGLLHRSCKSIQEPPDLSEKVAGRWLNIFRRHRMMCLICLSRSGGTFSLRPFDEESAEEAVHVPCGKMLILRADALSHTYSADTEGDMVLSCWLLQPDRSGMRGAFVDERWRVPLIPVAQDLVEWASNRLPIIKDQEETEPGSLADLDVPREWKLLASHSVSKGVQIAVKGIYSHVATGCETLRKHHCANAMGVDFAIEVPHTRWDHFNLSRGGVHYDPAPDCWAQPGGTGRAKTNIKHGHFIEGVDLFDNRFFNMSPMEGNVTDPCQRLALETAYAALHMAGYVKKTMMQAFIGVYQGHTASDWDKVEHQVAGGCAGSYSPTIASNRINFQLGLMGPSFTIDLEGAASLAAIYQGCHDLLPLQDFRKPVTAAGLAGGVTVMFAPYWWPVHNVYMNRLGRCLTFDENAAGYVKGEGSALVCLKRSGETVEGEFVPDDSKPNLALVPGFALVNSGRAASLTAPCAPAMTQVVADAVRLASLSPLDIDAVEVDGKGFMLDDAVEAVSMVKYLRGIPGGDEEVLTLSATKTKHAYLQETAGVGAFVTALMGNRSGNVPGQLHLKCLNPHVVTAETETALQLPSEAVAFRCQSAFTGVSAYGFGGSKVHTVLWGQLSEDNWPVVNQAPVERPAFIFWPGGGGELELEAQPTAGYSIVGSWDSWETPARMKEEGDAYVFIVRLGQQRFEEFQIMLDGDADKVLCPAFHAAPSGAPVQGPMPAVHTGGRCWRIDGRPFGEAPEDHHLARTAASRRAAPVPERPASLMDRGQAHPAANEVLSKEEGMPGDRYRVRLQVAGKWRVVVWERA